MNKVEDELDKNRNEPAVHEVTSREDDSFIR